MAHVLPNVEALENIALGLVVLAILFVVVALVRRRALRLQPLFLVLLAILLAHFALFMNPFGEMAARMSLHWNWGGKALSIVVTLLCIALFPGVSWTDAGFTWKQRGAVAQACIAVAMMCAFSWSVQLLTGHGHFTIPKTERLFFQATMPGLNEEPLYRGLALYLIDVAFFNETIGLAGARIGWGALITSIWFGVIHGFGIAGGHVAIDLTSIAVAGILGFALAWVRMRTGSLVFGVLGHNLINVGNGFFG